MRIEDFPRPPQDNGRGIHWSTRLYHDAIQPNLDYWIAELQAMHIKWVKLLDDGGGSGLALSRALLAAGIMPIVRLFLPQLNPSRLSSREIDTVGRYVDAGVRYFESNNEPDLPAEWANNSRPPDWLEIVVDNFIRDADGVLGRGGLLALPAMGPGSRDNALARVVEKGRRDLFERGCWMAIHNYTLNHPLDYPEDAVNQTGQPLTQQEFDAAARWQYSHLTYQQIRDRGITLSEDDYHKFQRWAWDGRSLEMVNAVRASNKNPGQNAIEAPNCFRGYLAAEKMMLDALGVHVPMISTEGGPVVGWGDDDRYPKMSPSTQMQSQLEITRFMQTQAPPWYFACCTWLLASRPLGDWNPTWEQMSWYTGIWDVQFGLAGQLPVVQAMKDEPSVVRGGPTPPPGPSSGLHGLVSDTGGQALAGAWVLVSGPQQQRVQTDAAGRYRCEGLPAGSYRVQTEDNQASIAGLALDGTNSLEADLTVPAAAGLRYAVVEKRLLPREENGSNRRFFGRVLDAAGAGLNGITLEMAWRGAAPGTQFPRVVTPRDLYKPAGNFEFLHSPGEFVLRVVQGDWPSDEADGLLTANVPGRENDPISYEVNFQLRGSTATAGAGSLAGVVTGGEGHGLTLWQAEAGQVGQAGRRSWGHVLSAGGAYRFDQLAAGPYALVLEGAGVIHAFTLGEAEQAAFNFGAGAPPQPPEKVLAEYWLFGRSAAAADLLLLCLPHLRTKGLMAGSVLAEAQGAQQVVIVGGEDAVSAADEQSLRAAGCQVRRLPGDPFLLAQAVQL